MREPKDDEFSVEDWEQHVLADIAPLKEPEEQPILSFGPKSIIPTAAPRLAAKDFASMPFAAVGILQWWLGDTVHRFGTVFAIAPDMLLTARHVARPGFKPSKFGLFIGYDAVRNPNAPRVRALKSAAHNYLDLAVIKVDAKLKHFDLPKVDDDLPEQLELAGYGFPHQSGKAQMTAADGPRLAPVDPMVCYKISTLGGDSGAPVYGASGEQRTVHAVHCHAEDFPGSGNYGTVLSKEVVEKLGGLIDATR